MSVDHYHPIAGSSDRAAGSAAVRPRTGRSTTPRLSEARSLPVAAVPAARGRRSFDARRSSRSFLPRSPRVRAPAVRPSSPPPLRRCFARRTRRPQERRPGRATTDPVLRRYSRATWTVFAGYYRAFEALRERCRPRPRRPASGTATPAHVGGGTVAGSLRDGSFDPDERSGREPWSRPAQRPPASSGRRGLPRRVDPRRRRPVCPRRSNRRRRRWPTP